jgi:hypothetical protein
MQLFPSVGREMDIPENAVSALRAAVLVKLGKYAKRLQGHMPTVLCEVGHFSNESFLLRAFVSLRTDVDSDELALSVDITSQRRINASTTVSVESDLCLDNGTIVAAGPSAEFDASSPQAAAEIFSWNKAFDAFLTESEAEAITVLRAMSSGQTQRRV